MQSKSKEELWRDNLNTLIGNSGIYEKKVLTPKQLFNNYKNEVKRLTEEIKHNVPNIEKRNWKEYHIDHRISIYYGYKNNIKPCHIAHLSNLRLISKQENCDKGTDNHIDETNEWILSEKGGVFIMK